MEATDKAIKLSPQVQRILKLLFKFRYITAQSLADVMGISRVGVYKTLERLVESNLVVKVYDKAWRIDRRPAYYYLSKPGVSTVRGLLDVRESVVHALYKNDTATPAFIQQSLTVLVCYNPIKQNLPEGSDLFTKAELNRFKQFPKNRPELFARTLDGREAMIVFVNDVAPYIVKKRLDEILTHSEDEGWNGDYPRIAFVLRDDGAKHSFLYGAAHKLENMGIDEEDLTIVATSIEAIASDQSEQWFSVYNPKVSISLLE